MKLAVYAVGAGPYIYTIKPARRGEIDVKSGRYKMHPPVLTEFPGQQTAFVTVENASAFGFENLPAAVEHITKNTCRGSDYLYSVVLADGKWTQKPVSLLSINEVKAEIAARTLHPAKAMKDMEARGSLEGLRTIAKQNITKYEAPVVPTVDELRAARKNKE